jgi:DtxR family Mn-dependent transcriptional regulator
MKPLSRSLEDYLEAVHTLSRRDGFARTTRVSALLKVSKPSVSAAVKALASRGLLEQEPYGYIRLSPSGTKAGAEIAGRHAALKDFFISILGMAAPRAERDACLAEHALSPGAISRLESLAAFLKAPARAGALAAARAAIAKGPGHEK